MNLRLILLTSCLYLAIALLIYHFNTYNSTITIKAKIGANEVYVDQPFSFRDSTSGSKSIMWEFGNGEKSTSKNGIFSYAKEGKYQVRLTVNNFRKTFFIVVKKSHELKKPDSPLSIYATSNGLSDQKIHFKLNGPKVEWCEWYFGSSGKIDSREKETFHKFSEPGTFKVKLLTNLNPKIPLIHFITITPAYKTADNVVKKPEDKPAGEAVDKLLIQIQSIANGGNLISIYNSMVKEHFCSNMHVKVSVNNKAPIDFYSYCQSLQLASGIKINQITPETDPKTGCTNKLVILQH